MRTSVSKIIYRLAACAIGVMMFTGMASAHHLNSVEQPSLRVAIERMQVPANAQSLIQLAMERLAFQQEVQAVKVAVQRQHSLQVSQISWTADSLVVTGHRLVRRQNEGAPASMWLEQVRVTVPRQHTATAWDVNALQKELERLGIKIKPKPAAPKPSQISG